MLSSAATHPWSLGLHKSPTTDPEKWVFDWALVLLVVSLPFSKAVGSLAEALMGASWLFSLRRPGQALNLRRNFLANKMLWGFPAVYLGLLWGSFYSENVGETWAELNLKHYFLTLPLMIGSWPPSQHRLRWALPGFVLANLVVAMSILGIVWTGKPWMLGTPEIPSPWIQRPRASIFLALSLLGLIHWAFETYRGNKSGLRSWVLWSLAFCLLLTGLLLLKGRIGQVGLVGGIAWMGWRTFKQLKNQVKVLALLTLACLLAWSQLDSVRHPFEEAVQEIKESQTGYPSSEPEFSSMGMRFTYWSTYARLWLEHPWLGVGTGDLVPIGRQLFENHPLEIPFHRPHNQWLELAVQLGIPGMVLLAWAWWLFWKNRPSQHRVLTEIFHLLFLGSTFLDSTLSTQTGISAFMALALVLHYTETDQDFG